MIESQNTTNLRPPDRCFPDIPQHRQRGGGPRLPRVMPSDLISSSTRGA